MKIGKIFADVEELSKRQSIVFPVSYLTVSVRLYHLTPLRYRIVGLVIIN